MCKPITLSSALIAALLLASGCASLEPTQSGYLSNYSHMQREGSQKMFYWQAGFDIHAYDSIVIEPVEVLIPDDQLQADALSHYQQLANNLETYLQTDLAPLFPANKQTSNKVLRLSAVITASDASSPTLNVLSTALLFIPLDTGGVGVELEIQDAGTGTTLYTQSRAVNGTVWQFLSSFSRYGHADTGLKTISRELAQELVAGKAYNRLIANNYD